MLLQAKIIDYGEAPELQVSKIIENHEDLTKGLEKKKLQVTRKRVTPRALASRAKNYIFCPIFMKLGKNYNLMW